MPDEKKHESWKNYPEFATAKLPDKKTYEKGTRLANKAAKIFFEGIHVLNDGSENLDSLIKQLENKSMAAAISHYALVDMVVGRMAYDALGIKTPFIATAEYIMDMPILGRTLRTQGCFKVDRRLNKGEKGRKYMIALADFGQHILTNGNLAFAPTAQRSRTGFMDDSKIGFGTVFLDSIRRAYESGRQVVLLVAATTYDRIPDLVIFGENKLGLISHFKANYGQAHVNMIAVNLEGVLASRRKEDLRETVRSYLSKAFVVKPSQLICYSMANSHSSRVTRADLEKDVQANINLLKSMNAPLANVQDVHSTVEYAMKYLKGIISEKGNVFKISHSYACHYHANIARSHLK
jgi:glycerol-3-phosphate O-acyltransferase